MEINVEEIMEEIRKKIDERGYDNDPLEFEQITLSNSASAFQKDGIFNARELAEESEYLNRNWNNPINISVSGRNKVITLFKKIVFKCTRFIFLPLVDFQNAYNASNARCIIQINDCVLEMEQYKKRVEELEKEVAQLKMKEKL